MKKQIIRLVMCGFVNKLSLLSDYILVFGLVFIIIIIGMRG